MDYQPYFLLQRLAPCHKFKGFALLGRDVKPGHPAFVGIGEVNLTNRIHWDEFSRSCPVNLLSETTLQKFASKWDWKALSNRDEIYNNWRLLEKFTDKVNWGEVITNWNIEMPLEFFSRFQQYILMSKLQDSRLWNAMVEARAKHLIQEAIGIE